MACSGYHDDPGLVSTEFLGACLFPWPESALISHEGTLLAESFSWARRILRPCRRWGCQDEVLECSR